VREKWKEVKLVDVCKLINGRAYSQNELLPAGLTPVLRVGNFFTNRNWYYSDLKLEKEKYCHTGDLLYAWSASFGPRIWEGGEAIFHYHIWKVIPNDLLLNKKFLFYFFELDKDLIRAEQGTGTTMMHVTKGAMEQRTLMLPPRPEQKRIVAILDEAFEGIVAAAVNAERNLANARELSDSSRDSLLRKDVSGWQETSLSNVCDIASKLVDPRHPEFIDLPHIGAGNILSGSGEIVDIKTAREEGLKSGKFLFDKKMVIYSKIRPYLKKACRPDFSGLCSADAYPLLPNKTCLDRNFLFHLLMSRHFTEYAIAGSDRAGMPKVNRDHLFRYRTWLPGVEEQRRLASKLDEISTAAGDLEDIYQEKLTGLAELKKSILQKAFSGELATQPKHLLKEATA
jgi:type I restriction enzyme, S subunit